jgi:hypothetical protein
MNSDERKLSGTVLRICQSEKEGFHYETAINFDRASQEQKERFIRFIMERSRLV